MVARACTIVIAGLALAGCASEAATSRVATAARERPTGVKETCRGRSMADFPGGFTSRRNLVVGPLSMIGAAAFTSPGTVREFGGNKFPLLVKAGHTLTLELTRRALRTVSLGYGPLPQGEVFVRDGHRVVTFVACPAGKESGSRADGERGTFWSGFVLANAPRCVRLDVWVDAEATPRHARIELGQRCR